MAKENVFLFCLFVSTILSQVCDGWIFALINNIFVSLPLPAASAQNTRLVFSLTFFHNVQTIYYVSSLNAEFYLIVPRICKFLCK